MKPKKRMYVIICIFLISCTPSNKQTVKTNQKVSNDLVISAIKSNKNLHLIDLDNPSYYSKNIHISSLFKQVKTVILETRKDVLIGSVTSIQIYKDSIFILDRTSSKGLFLFNKEGHFLKRYGTIGNGPGEFTEPTDFTMNVKDKILYVLDAQTQNIVVYNLNTGSFIKNIHILDGRFKSFHIQYVDNRLLADAYYYDTNNNPSMLQEINISTGERTTKWLPAKLYNKNYSGLFFAGNEIFYDRTQESPKYVQYFMDTVISVTHKDVMPLLAIKSDKLLKESDWKEIMSKGEVNVTLNLIKSNLIYHICEFATYKNIVFFTYTQGLAYRCCLLNTKTNTFQILNSIIDDLTYDIKDKNNSILPRFCTSNADGMYAYISPTEMDRFLKLAKENKLNKSLDKLNKIKLLPHDSNPIIFIYN
jgi:hypothetical protein